MELLKPCFGWSFVNNILLATLLLLLASKIYGQPSIESSSGRRRHHRTASSLFDDDGPSDDQLFGDSGDDFMEGEFDEMEKNDRFHDKVDEGFDLWEDKCLKIGGQQALDNWQKEQENMMHCVMVNFNVLGIREEIEAKKETGELDVVFKKYCGQPMRDTRPCIKKFLEVSRQCLKSKDRDGLNTTMNMVDAAINFMCHNSGDRMALFMAEKGVDCVSEHQEALMSCIDQTNLFSTVNTSSGTRRRSIDPVIVFDKENCRRGFDLRQCVERELLKCSDPTPSNVVNSMLLSMWKSTPCARIRSSHYSSSAPARLPPLSLSNFPIAIAASLASLVVIMPSTRLL